jgi:SH3-like domain-containing protein
LRVVPTNLVQAINSAPGAADEIIVAVIPTPTPLPTDNPTVITQATPAPVVTVVTGPTASNQVTARIVLDPGANLQLREYPSADARSLGLAPTGTVFVVNGREGAPIDILTGDEILLPDGTEFVDPATLLIDGQSDLAPASTWVNVTLTTPDGAVTAWVNTLFLDVRNPRGEKQRLADLLVIPRNRPGTSVGTVVTTPIPPENFARAVVYNLDAGVNLNIRRTAQSGGEVLARVTSGTSLRLIGVGTSGNWAFVEYSPVEGGTITGWAGTLYLKFEFRTKPQTVAELTAQNLIQAVDEATLRGEIRGDVPGLVQPTADPLRGVTVAQVVGLNPGVSLNLRRTPNVNAEVLANLPAGVRVRVFSRTNTLDWVEAEIDGVRGWLSTTYLVFSFNDLPVKLEDIPLSTDFGALPTAVPTNTPTATPSA